MFTTLLALSVVALQLSLVIIIIASFFKVKFNSVSKYSNIILRAVFSGAVLGSLIYEYVLGFEPCLLCWYQRIAIFAIAILLWTADIGKSRLLQKQILIFAIAGFAVALFHNYIDIFPTGLDACGATGPSCLIRYVYEFGFITIPMMSATVLLSGIIFTSIAKLYPQPSLDR